MTPEERELRRALEARSGPPSPEFRSRLSTIFAVGRPPSRRLSAFAAVAAAVVTIATVGVLVMAHHFMAPTANGGLGPASGSRTGSPSPTGKGGPPSLSSNPVYGPTTALISAPSPNAAWVLVADSQLYLSTDEGDTWVQRQMPSVPGGGGRWAISFADDLHGWALNPGSPATQCDQASVQIWRTSDGAVTWQLVASVADASHQGIEVAQCKDTISFVDVNHGFVTAWDDNHRPTIYRTSDGGATWSASVLPDPPDFVTSGGGFSLNVDWVKRFGSTLYLEAWGSQDSPVHDRQYMFQSVDGGATWSWLVKIQSRYIAMATESRWLQLVVPDQSYETTTSGQQWHLYASDFNTDTPVGGPQIVFAGPMVGYAEGRGALQRTIDGGAHWTRIKTPGVFQPG